MALKAFAFGGGNDTLSSVQLPNMGFVVATNSTTNLTKTASALFTFMGNATNGETVTIGPKTYTFDAVLLTNADGHVLIGASATNTATNLVAAISLGAGAGTNYATNMSANPVATAAIATGSTLTVSALTAGIPGNSIKISETVNAGSWALQQAQLSGGASSDVSIIPVNGLGIGVTVVGTNAVVGAVSNVVCTFALSADGTNFATTAPGLFTVSVTPNGKTNATVFTNLSTVVVGNAKKVRFITCNNQDTNGAVTVIAVPISYTSRQ